MRVHHSDNTQAENLRIPIGFGRVGRVYSPQLFFFSATSYSVSILFPLYFKAYGKEMEVDDSRSRQLFDIIAFQI